MTRGESQPAPHAMFRKFIRLLAIVSPLFVGLGATLYWLYLNDETAAHGISLRESALGLLLVAATTAVNLGLRWLRWHFLTRRFGARLLTRESFRVYFATLPLITTPFYFGEAFRGIFFGRSDPRVRGIGIKAWLAERVADAIALGVWMLWGAQYPWLAAAALLGFWVLSVWVLAADRKSVV